MSDQLYRESIMVPVGRDVQLHVCRLQREATPPGGPILMVHGAAEDGRVFWSKDGRGLGPFLARAGFDVFVPDLRGHGRSWPGVESHSGFGLHELVTEDLPALVDAVARRSGDAAQTWIGHGSGGLLLAAALLRGDRSLPVTRLVHFGVRRSLTTGGWRRRLLHDLVWHRVGRLAVALKGYLPARALRLGTQDESARCFYDLLNWSLREHWLDSGDGFDYSEALRKGRRFPRSLYFAAASESAWSAPEDVRAFMQELGPHDARFVSIGEDNGNLADYDHLSMLLDPRAEQDHFPQLLAWLEER